MLNLFKRPINEKSLESWSTNLDDIAKVALLAIPVVIYGNDFGLMSKIFHTVMLILFSYIALLSSTTLRNNKDNLTKGA